MNKVFALKYSLARGGMVPVPECCRKKSKASAKSLQTIKSIPCGMLLLSCVYAGNSQAGLVNDAYNYQIYRDFAENKGQFTPGAQNLEIYKRNNHSGKPDIVLKQPMPDFSSVASSGLATLVAPSYIVSVTHNSYYGGVNFNGTNYTLIARNEKGGEIDFHVPRLNKFVVDAAPANLLPFNMYDPKQKQNIWNKKRFSAPFAVRLGGGIQKARLIVKGQEVTKNLIPAYHYLTGGMLDDVSWWANETKGKNSDWTESFDAFPQHGDSGSPLFIWDNQTQKWELIGVAESIAGYNAYWTHVHIPFLNHVMKKDRDPDITLNGEKALWHHDSIDTDNHSWKWTGITEKRKIANQTKHLVFSGGGEVVLTKNINQGAGGIFFDQNQRYTFSGVNSTGNPFFWQGAGLDVAKGTTVDWNIAGVNGDFLHKIGEGRLNVNVVNHGGLRLGDGIVALNTANPAFSKIYLTSGRGTLFINSDNSFNPNQLYFNGRGGTLNLNGHDVAFQRINTADIGARIVNNNTKAANLSLTPVTSDWLTKRGTVDHYIFHGNITGNINIHIDGRRSTGSIIVDGNIDTPQGTLSAQGDHNLVFQGHPVRHAYNSVEIANALKSLGDNSVKTQPVSFNQPDWESRIFRLKQINLTKTQFYLARNATLSADIQADHSRVVLGSPYVYKDSKDGEITSTAIRNSRGTSVAADNTEKSLYNGHVDLHNLSTLEIRENFYGSISASNGSIVSVLSLPERVNSQNVELEFSTLNIGALLPKSNTLPQNNVLSEKKALSDDNVAEYHIDRLNAKNSSVVLSAANAPHRLAVDEFNARDSAFLFTVYPVSQQTDYLTMDNVSAEDNNRLVIHYPKEETSAESLLPRASEQLIIHSNKAIANTVFTLDEENKDNPYSSALAVKTTDRGTDWWLISMRDNAPWQLNDDRQYNSLDLRFGGRVVFTAPANTDDWSVHRLTVNTLNANNVTFDLNARAHTGESDSIYITQQAIGDDNQLDVHFLLADEQPLFSKDLLLASAPDATPDSYFTIHPVSSGLTLLIPNGKIISKEGKKQWLLSLTDPNESATTETSDDPAAPTSASSETVVAPVTTEPAVEPASEDAVNTKVATTETVTEPATTVVTAPATREPLITGPLITDNHPPQPASALFNPFTLKLADLDRATDAQYLHQLLQQAGINVSPRQMPQYQRMVAHAASMVRDVETLVSLPKVAFVLETNQLNKRLGDVRQLGEDQGLWIKTSAGRASYQAMDLRYTTVQLGVDRKIDNHLFGIMGSYTRGSSQGATSSEKHTTAGAALYYSWVPDQGMFVDVIGKYLRNYQHFTFPTDAAIAEQFPRSTTLLGSVQLGYLAKFNSFNHNNLFIEPSIELLAGHTSGYRMNGRDFSVQVKNSNPLYSKIGVAAGYQWQFAPQRTIAVSASLYRLQNLHRGGAVELIGQGINNRRVHPAAWDNRYLASFSVNARLSENWRIYSQLETSFAGQIKKDISGQIALRYQF